ncbi:MAG: response regulator [Ignavibacteriales bacterium]|nr:response regulator [Ignavibacteriales bacterium]
MNILIVDDAENVRHNILRLLVQESGMNTFRQAASCSEAMVCLETEVPAILIVDLKLPDGSGFEIIEKASQLTPKPLIIVLSNFGLTKFRERALSLGASYFLIKLKNLTS